MIFVKDGLRIKDFTYEGGPMGSVALPKYANLKYMWYDLER
ncbi:MAG: hypothetical protein ACLUVG_17040 [Phocaeicola vulgatus]